MECRVEDRDLRHARHQPQASPDAVEVGRVVERRELAHLLDLLEDGVGDERRLDELLAAVDDAVADRDDLAHVLHDAPLGVGQEREDVVHRLVVAVHLDVERDLPVALRLLDDPPLPLGDADAFGQAPWRRPPRCPHR